MNTRLPQSRTGKQEFIAGVFEELPLQLGVAPFGLVFGILGTESGLSPIQTICLSLILFGGASQIVFAQLIAAATPFGIILSSVTMINLRHLLYGLSMASYLRILPVYWRVLLAYLLTDEAYAVTINRLCNAPAGPYQHYHLLGTGLLLWVCWQITTITGVVFGATIPPEWSLEFVIPLTFIAIVVPILRRRADFVACAVAAIIAVAGQPLPWKSWIILAALGGILAGWLALRATRQRAAP